MKIFEMHIQEIGQIPIKKVRFKAENMEEAEKIADLRLKGSFYGLIRIVEVKDATVSKSGG